MSVEITQAHLSASEQPASEGRVRYHGNAELTGGLQDAKVRVLDIEGEDAVLDLNRGDWVHGVCAADCIRGALRQPDVANLALPVMEE